MAATYRFRPLTAKRGIVSRPAKRIKGMPVAVPPETAVPAAELAAAELPPDFVAASRAQLARFVAKASSAGNTLVLCHSDADGLAAGAILTAALRRAGVPNVDVLATGKGGNAWSDETGATLDARKPGALIVTDLGVRAEPVIDGTPTLLVDHHRPSGLPPSATETVITGYGLDPTPTSGILALACAGGLGGVNTDDLDWIAAVSALSDLGDKAPFAIIAAAKKRYGAGVLRDTVTLLNAPRRSASGDASKALELLLSAEGPRDIAKGEGPLVDALRRDKEEVNAAYNEAKKAGPKFAGEAAAIRIHTPCQVHPLVAQIWRTRLPKFIVMGVNTGFRPGWVHFSARCGKDKNLLDFFRAHRPDGADPNHYGNGHDQAGGGALPVAVWNVFARDLGFGPDMQVDENAVAGSVAPDTTAAAQSELFPA